MGIPAEERLQRGYRTLRRVSAGADAPWAGTIVSTTADGSGVLVDAASLPGEWRGWDAAPSGHVLAPRDVVRRADGHDVLLPVCTERAVDFLERRRARRMPLSAGEGVTLCISVLRGLAEAEGRLEADSTPLKGTWWLTDEGRPLLATDAGEGSAREASIDMLTRVCADVPDLARPLAEAIAAVRRGSLVREIDRMEPSVFDAAAPEPLATTVLATSSLASTSVAASAFGPASARAVARDIDDGLAGASSSVREGWGTSMLRHVDADWADAFSRATTGVWRALRERRPRAGHRRPLLAATAVAGVILVGGLMWPVGDEKPATADADSGSSSSAAPVTTSDVVPPSTATASAAPNDPTDTGLPADLAVVAADLLSSRSDCIDDMACLEHVMQSPDTSLPAGVIDRAADARVVSIVDDLGGLAVLRVDAVDAAAPSQLVVIVRRDERWLLRDVYDVTQ